MFRRSISCQKDLNSRPETRLQMKAIIPVAGAGTKLRPHTYTQPKALIPLAGKTILSIIVDQLREAGIKEFIFIIGYLGEKIQDYVSSLSGFDLSFCTAK